MKRASALRTELFLRGGALLVLGAAAYSVTVAAFADHLSRGVSLADRERAVRMLPTSAILYERLAALRDEQAGDPLPDLEHAAALDPANARYLEQLGERAEIAGNLLLAERSLVQAAARSRLYQPRYLLAQFYFRRGNAAAFDEWSRAALDTAPGDVTPLLDLCWRTAPDPVALADRAMPARPLIARQVVAFLVGHGGTGAALRLARQLAETGGPDDLGALLGFANQALADADPQPALAVWNTLCRRRLLSYVPLDTAQGGQLTNADFARPTLSAGFDWHLEPPAGAAVSQTGGSLRVTFSGGQPENCVLAWQYVPLPQGSAARMRSEIRALDAPSASGVGWSTFYPSPEGWREGAPASAPGSAEVARIALMYRRPHGEPRLTGTVAVSALHLEIQP